MFEEQHNYVINLNGVHNIEVSYYDYLPDDSANIIMLQNESKSRTIIE